MISFLQFRPEKMFETLNANYVNILMMQSMMTVVSTVTALLTKFFEYLGPKVIQFFTYLYELLQYYCPYFRTYTITVQYDKFNLLPEENNKIVIDAILYNFHDATNYELSNRKTNKDGHTNMEKELNRDFVYLVNDTFVDDGITIHFDKEKNDGNGNTSDKKSKNESTVNVKYYVETLTLTSSISVKHIENYIKKKRNNYINKFYSDTNGIYVYVPRYYSERYVEFIDTKFIATKTFDHWICSKKNEVLKLIDNFQHKQGIYQLVSNPYKLGFLLHGKPGCGKTTFIKALANRLNRHIIPISLDKFSSVSSFINLFCYEYMAITQKGDSYTSYSYVPLDKRIIVFEDIDTAGNIVKTREIPEEDITLVSKVIYHNQ